MKIVNEMAYLGFRTAYSFRIESRQEHKNYLFPLLGRFVVAIKTFFSDDLEISVANMKKEAEHHENYYFAILLRKIELVEASESTHKFVEKDREVMNEIYTVQDLEKILKMKIMEKNLGGGKSKHWKKYKFSHGPAIDADVKKRRRYWRRRKESALSEISKIMNQ